MSTKTPLELLQQMENHARLLDDTLKQVIKLQDTGNQSVLLFRMFLQEQITKVNGMIAAHTLKYDLGLPREVTVECGCSQCRYLRSK